MAIVRDLAFFDSMVFHLGLTMVAISNMDSVTADLSEHERRIEVVLRIVSDMMHQTVHDEHALMPDMRSGLLIPTPYWFARWGEEHQGMVDSFDSSVGTWTETTDNEWTLDLDDEECITDELECELVQGSHNAMLIDMAGTALDPINVDDDDEPAPKKAKYN